MRQDATDTIELSRQPLVWSDKRQSLCDTLPYFKSHQGSLYSHDLIARGILIDGEITIRDTITPNVIITALWVLFLSGLGGCLLISIGVAAESRSPMVA